MSILQISQVSKTFSTHGAITQALTATDLTVEENDFITILGPSNRLCFAWLLVSTHRRQVK
jgi:NitT/TauT family transport system ATP-binding protein/sulfonate transport system ATP-binding protein